MDQDRTEPAISAAGRGFLKEGMELLRARNHAGAMASFRKLTGSDPGLAIGWVLVSDQELRAGRAAEARSAAQRAVEVEAASPDGWMALGAVHAHAEEFEEAEACYRRAVAANPSSEELWERVLASMLQNGMFEETIALCAEETARSPGDWRALARLGSAYAASDRLQEAMDAWRQVLAIAPDEGHTRLVMAQTLHMMDDDEACLGHCRETLLRPDIGAEVKEQIEKLVKQVLGGQPRR
jgi:tetratricopeptide (TPR) repeat protein